MASKLTYLGTHGRNPDKDVQPLPRLGAITRGDAKLIDDATAQVAGFESGDDLALFIYTLFVPRGDDEPHPRFKLEKLNAEDAKKHQETEERERKRALADREKAAKVTETKEAD